MACCRSVDQDVARVAKILATRHGEIVTILRLLETMVHGDTPSPAAFINSVYSTPVGYFDLCTGNRQPARTVSGGDGSFAYAFLEGLSLLQAKPQRPVLLLAGEEAVPEPFAGVAAGREHPWAAAVLIGGCDAGGDPVMLDLANEARAARHGSDALDFLAWWVSGAAAFVLRHEGRQWRWRRR